MTGSTMTPKEILDRYFLETRARLLEIAAHLDRIDRAAQASDSNGAARTVEDSRRKQIEAALAILAEEDPGRAERIQQLFSRDYDPHWLDDFDGADVLRRGA